MEHILDLLALSRVFYTMDKQCDVKLIRLPVVNLLQETLGDYVRRVINEKGLNYREVARRSGGAISHATVGYIVNNGSVDVRRDTLQALAVGLGVSEDELYAVARGKILDYEDPLDEVKVLFNGWHEASDEDRAATMELIRMIAEGFQKKRQRTTKSKTAKSNRNK